MAGAPLARQSAVASLFCMHGVLKTAVGPLQELSTEAPNISEDAVQLMKFHGSYMQVRFGSCSQGALSFEWLTAARWLQGAYGTGAAVLCAAAPVALLLCAKLLTTPQLSPPAPGFGWAAQVRTAFSATCQLLLALALVTAGQPRGAHVWRGQVVPVYDAHAAARGLRHQPAVPGDGRAGGPGEASITVYLDAARTETCCQLYLVMDELADLVSLSLLLCLPCTARILACRCRSRCLSPPLQLRCGMLLLHCMLPPPLLLLLPCMLPPPPPLHLLLSAQLLCRALLLSAETPCVLLSSLPCSTATARCA